MIPLFKAHTIENPTLVNDVLESGMLGEGNVVAKFRNELETLFSHEYVLPLNSCTSSLILALRLCNVSHGDDVISTPFTMIATNSAIQALGANIVWSDIEPETLCASYDSIKNSITSKTKAIIVTCVGGLVPRELELYESLGIPLILDCAHALSTQYRGKHISKWGNYACFSFQAIKHLTTGDGGAITFNGNSQNQTSAFYDYSLAERLKWFGMSRDISSSNRLRHQMEVDIEQIGYKFQLNDISAAVGLSCFSKSKHAIEASRSNANYYLNELRFVKDLQLLKIPETCIPSWWVFGFLYKNAPKLIEYLILNGVQASQLWRRNDDYSCFQSFCSDMSLLGMDKVQEQVVFIPSGWWVSNKDRKKIVQLILDFK